MYIIQISLKSESFINGEHYFWCILKMENEKSYNCGHGWATDINKAATDAYKYYIYNILNNTI